MKFSDFISENTSDSTNLKIKKLQLKRHYAKEQNVIGGQRKVLSSLQSSLTDSS